MRIPIRSIQVMLCTIPKKFRNLDKMQTLRQTYNL